MQVKELIALLQEMPQHLEVTAWDEEEDEFVPVVSVVWEDGTSEVSIMSNEEEYRSIMTVNYLRATSEIK